MRDGVETLKLGTKVRHAPGLRGNLVDAVLELVGQTHVSEKT
jgi:hypothetical protein